MLSWMPQIENESGPKYLAIAEALLADVQSGRLKPGHRLPPQRQLAKELGVDLTTVTRAFNETTRVPQVVQPPSIRQRRSSSQRRPRTSA